MEPLAQPADQPTDNVGKPKHRRRLWLLILFLTLAAAAACLVFVLSAPSARQFRFLDGAHLEAGSERLLSLPPLPDTWLGITNYRTKYNGRALIERVKRELTSKGWRLDTRDTFFWSYNHPTEALSIKVAKDGEIGFVSIWQSHEATAVDRIRIWLKERLPFLARSNTSAGNFE